MQRFTELLPLERMHGAWSNETIVGGAGAFPFSLTVPGGELPTAGVTVVGVLPTHRRRGVLRSLMRAQLDDAHERGEPLAALWASEESIYGRFGYGLASFCGEITLAHEYTSFAQPFEPQGTLRLIEPAEAQEAIPPVFERIRPEWPGMFSRNKAWWENREIADPEERRDGAGPKRWVAYERDGSIEGYAAYRHKPGFEAGTTNAELRVLEALGTSPEALRDLWAYLLAVDWIATVRSYLLPPDHPLFLLLATPRRLRYRMGDGIWIRPVDVGAALSGRTYSTRRLDRLRRRGRVLPVERGTVDARRRPRRTQPGHTRAVAPRAVARLGAARRRLVRRAPACGQGRGAQSRRDRPSGRALPLGPPSLVPRDLLTSVRLG